MMYTIEQRKKAVETFIANDYQRARTVRQLGYPAPKTLSEWYKAYCCLERNNQKAEKQPAYTAEQKLAAIEHYYANGEKIARTCKALGYPSRPTLTSWIMDGRRTQGCWHNNPKYKGKLKPKMKQKQSKAVTKLSAERDELLQEKEKLAKQIACLNADIERLKLEHEMLLTANDIIKKEMGIDIEMLPNRIKAMVIDTLKRRCALSLLLRKLHMAKSSYYYQIESLKKDKYETLRPIIIQIYTENFSIYGYRRIHAMMKKEGIIVSEKVVRKIMHQERLFVSYAKHKKFNSYLGEITPHAENIIKRNFRAEKPNEKWLTDITEFKLPAGKVYLSPMLDCYDGMPVTWTIGTSPNAELANTMLDQAIAKLPAGAKPIVHSDRGGHYRWEGWLRRMRDAGLTRSMSKKSCCPDNSACEGFFGRLKNEMFYGRNWSGVSLEEFSEELNAYIIWYTNKRIKLTLGALSPADYRRKQGVG